VGNANPQEVVVFCIDLGAPPGDGEILWVTGDMQVTDDLGYDVGITTQLLLTDDCKTADGTEISEANGTNVVPATHELASSRSGELTVEAGNSRQAVVMVAWAASTASKSGDRITVNQDYGRLAVLRWR
jgi:hypothetical protein